MKLHTNIPLKSSQNQIGYENQILILGSCFAKNIGKKLAYFKFQSEQNPFGILFHPLAIENLVVRAVKQKEYVKEEIFFENGLWHCYDAHSQLSDASKEVVLERLNNGLKKTQTRLTEATHVIITLGTAWVYRHQKTNRVVANCHKVSQKDFIKELLSADNMVKSLENIIESVQTINKNVQFIFTVSPVRHLKDGFIENQRSKAHLIMAVHNLLSFRAPALSSGRESRNNSYFPSYFEGYELMMDELRDYRFYAKDMVHPNELAIDYIWEKFKETWISSNSYETMKKVDEIRKGLVHKPFHPDSEQHKKFLKTLGKKITYLQQEYDFMKFNL